MRTLLIVATLLGLSTCRERVAHIDERVRPPSSALASVRSKLESTVPARASASAADELIPEASIWRSRARCEQALAKGDRSPRSAGSARLGTWNVRWYPDGKPGRSAAAGGGTDIAWLACAIAWLDVDALAVQEFKAHPRAQERSTELLRALDRHTGGRWQLVLDDCRGGDAGQHVGILYDSKRVRATAPIVLGSLNPHGIACKNQLRPGLALGLVFPGGLDLHFVSVHFKSGSDRRSIDLRARSFDALAAASRELQARAPDADLIVAGDFNTMGCRKCSPQVAAADELAETSRTLAALAPPFRRVDASATCTEYFDGGSGLLDHFVVATAMREVAPAARAKVSGYCGEAACLIPPGRSEPSVSAAISDHCPVVLEISDRDLD